MYKNSILTVSFIISSNNSYLFQTYYLLESIKVLSNLNSHK